MVTAFRKDSVRGFLLFCLKLVNTDEEDRQFVIREAIRKGTVKEYIEHYGLGKLPPEHRAAFILGDAESLSCNVLTMAELLTRGEDFVVEHETPHLDFVARGIKDYLSSRPWQGKGTVKYLTGDIPLPGDSIGPDKAPFDITPGFPDQDDGIQKEKACPSSRLSEAFFAALRVYREAKQTDFFDIPLKICEWCDRPFFGKRFDQRFCNRDHSQRWHARNSYEKRKKSGSRTTPKKPVSPPPKNTSSTLVSYKLPQKF